MLRILNKIRKIGIVTESVPMENSNSNEPTVQMGKQLRTEIMACFSSSLAIRQVDAGSCNGCELEIHALNNPYYSVERFGVHFVASPRHADVLLVTGPVSRHMQTALLRTYEATPAPKWVIALGDCAIHGGEFGCSYASCGGVDRVLPVAAMIPGCPPSPLQIIQGILAWVQKI